MECNEKISVIMGIYNCAETLAAALDSIINQTYTNWEIIMCDDGSVDNTLNVALSYKESYPDKITVIRNDKNCGLNHTLNRCLEIAAGDYIARMDGDDLCSPERFEKEMQAFREHPEVAIVSTDMAFFDEKGTWGRTNTKPFPTAADFLKCTPFCHAPCLVKKEAFDAVQGYTEDKRLLRVEDYHLWMKMYAAGYTGMNLLETLYQMRDDRNAKARRKFKYRLNESYVKALTIKTLKLPVLGYIYCLRPILIGLLPGWIYTLLHRKQK